MTNEEKINRLRDIQLCTPIHDRDDIRDFKALEAAIEDIETLGKIRAEIDKIYEREGSSFDCLNALDELKEFIDKHMTESEADT